MLTSFLTPVLLSFLLFPTHILAAPAGLRISIPKVDPRKILCQFAIIDRFLCPDGGLNSLSRVTPLGTASGVMDPDGAHRYVVKYANAARWAPSTLVNTWSLPNGSNDPSALPRVCPQTDIEPSTYSEDCLSLVLYVPPSLTPLSSNAPVMVWIHGGSFVVGSATEAGLDGSKLALATGSIVVVVQYRLGALGFLAPNGNTNLAVKDVVNALQFLKNNVAYFGGSPNKVTLAGQSSGANMIRTLLGAPSASSLFRSAILQSDPMNFGLLRPNNQATMMGHFTGKIGCNSASCQNSVSLDSILQAQREIFGEAVWWDPVFGLGQPIRPVLDGTFFTNPIEPGASFPSSVNKPLLVTTVKHEGISAIYKSFDPVDADFYDFICGLTFQSRTTTIQQSPFYVNPPANIVDGVHDFRPTLALMATDYLYKCSGWSFGKAYAEKGGQVFLGEYAIGATYPDNADVPECSSPDTVCHQDDIQIVFGTVPNPTPAQSALITQMQQWYKSFLQNNSPNAPGLPNWPAATSSDPRAIVLGGTGSPSAGACDPAFWGAQAEYDYQFFY
ncbi:crystal protein [Coprinopsis marcescibilis]|uniref:Carboxylic ester hydrolase n=1 Tax=Coprinopsis marcescibilis TaxID=230819 RepID=A0A5C3LBM6_COPMA|nr:crystal protein [Coprinopsis marcescibilis]